MVTRIVVWSDVRSRHDSTVNFCLAIPLVIQKSKRSGRLLVSLGQYVG